MKQVLADAEETEYVVTDTALLLPLIILLLVACTVMESWLQLFLQLGCFWLGLSTTVLDKKQQGA